MASKVLIVLHHGQIYKFLIYHKITQWIPQMYIIMPYIGFHFQTKKHNTLLEEEIMYLLETMALD